MAPSQSYEDMLLWNPKPPQEILGHGILVELTKGILWGAPGSFKSLLSQQLGFCLATGTSFLGVPTAQGKVLVVQSEIAHIPYWSRVKSMGRRFSTSPVPTNTLYFDSDFIMPLDIPLGQNKLEREVATIQPMVLILDPLYRMVTSSREECIQAAIGFIDHLIDKYRLTVLLIHHSRKPKTGPSGQLIDQGGTELRGPLLEMWADSMIRITGDTTTDHRFLEFNKLRHATALVNPFAIKLDRSTLWFYKS